MDIKVNDILILKKKHVCGSDRWIVTRTGAELKIKCEKCGREIMIFKPDLTKRIKKIVSSEE